MSARTRAIARNAAHPVGKPWHYTIAAIVHPASGGLATGQVIVTDSPRQMHFFAAGAPELVLTPSVSWAPRAGVCTCVDTVGTAVDVTNVAAQTAALVGRWLWCEGGSGPGSGIGSTLGIEFTADGAWYYLNEDPTGAVARATSTNEYGTWAFMPTPANGGPVGPLPLTVVRHTAADSGFGGPQVVITTSPRVLFFGIETTGSANGQTQNVYSILFPMP